MSWSPIVAEVASWITYLGLTGATAAVVSWALFKWLGKKWIEGHFAKELESFRTEKQIEIEKLRTEYGRETERLKADLNRYADRASLFHIREYEVLPEAWGLMNKAYGATFSAISAFQEHPDLNRMVQSQFEDWLGQSDLQQYQKDELSASTDRNQSYMKMSNWNKIFEADRAAMDFMNYVILQGVFIEESLSEKMSTAGLNMRKSLISRKMAESLDANQYADGKNNFWEQSGIEIRAVEAVVLEVKQEVRQRLSNIRLAPE